MPLPHLLINNKKIAIFKQFEYFYGPFINTTPLGKYSVPQKINIHNEAFDFNWASSEQAYHAQKILHLKAKLRANDPRQNLLTNALWAIHNYSNKGSFLPDDYKMIVDDLTRNYPTHFGQDKKAFDQLCDANFHLKYNPNGGINPATHEPYTLEFMRTVIRLKLQAHPNLKQMAMQMASEGILPIEVSRYDYNWASGPDGTGLNMLGILVLEEGNRLVVANNRTPAIIDPRAAYTALQKSHKNQLTHDVLEPQQKQLRLTNTTNQKHQVQLPSSQHAGYWVCSEGLNRAAFILNGTVILGIYRNNPSSEWQNGNNLSKFEDLKNNNPLTIKAFEASSELSWVYNNANPSWATKAALFQNGKAIVGIFKRNGAQSNWEQSGDLSQFVTLQPKKPIHNASVTKERVEVPSLGLTRSNEKKEMNRLINKLYLNSDDADQMHYWQNKVKSGGTLYKGYTLPHSIAKVLREIDSKKDSDISFKDFKITIEASLKQDSGSLSSKLGLAGFFRSTSVSELRKKAKEGSIESFNPALI